MFNYYGSKGSQVLNYPAPRYDVIVEPFAGSAAYAVRHRRRARRVVLIEKDSRVAELWWRLLRRTSADALLSAPLPVVGTVSSDLLVAFASARTTRDTPASGFVVTSRMVEEYARMRRRVASVLDECRHFEVICNDYTEAPDIEATWFVDPPYQADGVGRWDRSRGGRYACANVNIDYPALAEWARSRRGQVIVCEQEGADWLPWTESAPATTEQGAASRRYREVWWTSDPTEQPDLFGGVA